MSYNYGVPLTDEERFAQHRILTGETTLPPRGTGRANSKKASAALENANLFWVLVAGTAILLVGEVYVAWKSGFI